MKKTSGREAFREVLLKGQARYSRPPSTYKFRSAPFYIENIISFFTQQPTLTRRPTVLNLPPQLVLFPEAYYKLGICSLADN
jgi:hypothetical protein